MTVKLTQLDNYLQTDYRFDTWSDFAVELARQDANTLSEQDFVELRQIWKNRPTYWQRQLASSLFTTKLKQGLSFLESMLESDNKEVLEEVIDCLEGRDDVYVPSKKYIARLKEVQKQFVGTYYFDAIEILINRVKMQSET